MKIAIIQELPEENDTLANQQLGLDLCRQAVSLYQPDLVLFPEMWSNGFSMCPLDSSESSKWKDNSIDSDHEYLRAFMRESIALSTNIAITYLEKDSEGGLFNSVSILDRHGVEVLHYSKTQICNFGLEELQKDEPDYYEIGCDYALTPGNTYDVCKLETRDGIVSVGAMICADREFPEVSTRLFNNGVEIIIVPNSCTWDTVRDQQFRSRSFEILGGVVLANYPEPKNNGSSCAYDCVVWDDTGKERDHTILKASSESGIYLAEFDIQAIRDFRAKEHWRVIHKLAMGRACDKCSCRG